MMQFEQSNIAQIGSLPCVTPPNMVFYKSNMIKALFFRGTTDVAFELCDIAQIGALLRVHRPDFVLAKNTIQFLPEVFSSSNFWPN